MKKESLSNPPNTTSDLSRRRINVVCRVLPQSFLGFSSVGVFYGWGALSDEINRTISPDNPKNFLNQHGTFFGIVVLCLLSVPMPLLQYVIAKKYISEFNVHVIGVITITLGFFLGGISLEHKLLWLFYLGGAVPCGIGCICIFSRVVFNHQIGFNNVGLKNMGSGICGFFIGVWAVFFFVISVPLCTSLSASEIFYFYGGMLFVLALWPLLTIRDDKFDVHHYHAPNQIDECKNCEEHHTSHPLHLDSNVNNSAINIENGETDKPHQSNTSPTSPTDDNISQNHHTEVQVEVQGPRCHVLKREPTMLYEGYRRMSSMWQHSVKNLTETQTNIDEEGFPLTNTELLGEKEIWILCICQAAMLTPGWGLNLAAFSILVNLFRVSKNFCAIIASCYVACYAIGRLFAGAVAQEIGARRAYDFILWGMFVCLMILPVSLHLMPHDSSQSSGCAFFSVVLCMIGILYGGAHALMYSLVYDIYGVANYKPAFALSSLGFALAVIVGGLSSAYSFSGPETGDAARDLAEHWFYAMAGSALLGWVLVRMLGPYNYKVAAARREVHVSAKVRGIEKRSTTRSIIVNLLPSRFR